MGGWSKFVSMELSDEEKLDTLMPIPASLPEYPCGLRICLCDPELDKLGLDDEMPEIGDVIDLRAFASVTSVSNGPSGRRIELQITQLAVEDENDEDME